MKDTKEVDRERLIYQVWSEYMSTVDKLTPGVIFELCAQLCELESDPGSKKCAENIRTVAKEILLEQTLFTVVDLEGNVITKHGAPFDGEAETIDEKILAEVFGCRVVPFTEEHKKVFDAWAKENIA